MVDLCFTFCTAGGARSLSLFITCRNFDKNDTFHPFLRFISPHAFVLFCKSVSGEGLIYARLIWKQNVEIGSNDYLTVIG